MGIGDYKINVIAHVQIDGTNGYEVSVNNRTSFVVFTSPFGNCQSFGIRSFEYLIGSLIKNEDISYVIKLVKEKLGFSRPLLVIDVRQEDLKSVKDFLNIYSEMPYKNYNSTKMNLCLIDTVKIKDVKTSKE